MHRYTRLVLLLLRAASCEDKKLTSEGKGMGKKSSMKSHKNGREELNANVNSSSKCIGRVKRGGNNSKKTTHRLESTVKASHLYSNTPCPSQDSASCSLQRELESTAPTVQRLIEGETRQPLREQLSRTRETAPSTTTTSVSKCTSESSSLHDIHRLHSPPIQSIVNVSDFTSIEEWNEKVNEEFNSIYQTLCSTPLQSLCVKSLDDKRVPACDGRKESERAKKEAAVAKEEETRAEAQVLESRDERQVINTTAQEGNCQVNSDNSHVINNKQLHSQMNVSHLNSEEMRNFNRSPQPWSASEMYEYKSQSSSSQQSTLKPGNSLTIVHPIEYKSSPLEQKQSSSVQYSKSNPPPVPPKPIMWPSSSSSNTTYRKPAPPQQQQQQQHQIPSVIITDVTNKSKIEKIDTIEKTEQLFDENFNQVYSEAVNFANSPSPSRRGIGCAFAD